MTKERKLAIQMWINIRDILSASDGQSPERISCYKKMFCEDHGLHWECNCWFCQYIQCCDRCPLHGCHHASDYYIVMKVWLNTDARVEACNNIIKALGGEE